jgi:hypothetical protein
MNRARHTLKYYRSRNILYEFEDVLVYGQRERPYFAVKIHNRWYDVQHPIQWRRPQFDQEFDIANYDTVKAHIKEAVNYDHRKVSYNADKYRRRIIKTETMLDHLQLLQQVLG